MTWQAGSVSEDPGPGLLGSRVRQARARAFVGREPEMAVLEAALRGDDGAASVVFVHGPGGIGKTMLLRRVAERAGRYGRTVVEVDGRMAGRSSQMLEAAARPATTAHRALLIIDTFEQCQWLETWLRDRFLAGLPADAVVVVAGREPPDPQWVIDPGWAEVVTVLKLAPLAREPAAALLAATGLTVRQRDAVLRFAGGNPLVLSLAAAVAAPTGGDVTWTPSAEVLPTLLSKLVGDVPSPAHRRALTVAARAFTTDEDLLRAVLGDDDRTDPAALFTWLATLPYVESVGAGVRPHDAVREALTADLRWRNAAEDDEVRTRLRNRLLRRVREVAAPDALSAMAGLAYVDRDTPRIANVYLWDGRDRVESTPLLPADLPVALAMVRDREGAESAAIARHWYERQPAGFALYRAVDTGEPVGVTARLVLTAPRPEDLDADPVVAAAWRHCQRVEPLAEGQHVAIRRFTVEARESTRPGAVTDLASWQSLAAICRSTGLAYAFVVHRDTEFWRTWLGTTTDEIDETPSVGGHAYAVFVNDWRYLTFERYWEWVIDRDPAAGPEPAAPELDRAAFDDAVREALGLWRRRGGLAGSPLAATGLVTRPAEDVDTALRATVRSALEGMRADQRTLRGHDAVVATYLSASTTQQAAARRLGVPFSTYRRHLKSGIEELSERLWKAARHGGR